MSFRRLGVQVGNSSRPLQSQPVIRGRIRKDSSGEFAALPLPSELTLETEDPLTAGGVTISLTDSRTLSHVISRINTEMAGAAEAEERNGCLVLRSAGVGQGAFIRVRQPLTAFPSAASFLGFPQHPNPLATARAGDMLDAPVRPGDQDNPVGTTLLARAEDRLGEVFNRALAQGAINDDFLYKWASKPLPLPTVIEVDETTHAAYFTTTGTGQIDQINLGDLSVFDSVLAGKRLFTGELAASSTLWAISEFWGVYDSEGKQIPAGSRTVRIGPVTRGQRGAGKPTYVSDFLAPSGALGNTSGIAPDGLNALGVARTKSTENITSLPDRTTLVCSGATFVDDGVVAGDIATITLAAVNVPFNHNGVYLVETVVDNQTIVIRPGPDSDSVRELNPDASGPFGQVTITSGDWEQNIWVTLEPSLPKFPPSGKLFLVIPVEFSLSPADIRSLTQSPHRIGGSVHGWIINNLWKKLSLGGVYDGIAGAQGSGFYADITHRALTAVAAKTEVASSGSVLRSSTGAATLDLNTFELTCDSGDEFLPSDVGAGITLTGGSLLAGEPWAVIAWIDNRTIAVAPPSFKAGSNSAGTVSVTWTLILDDRSEIPSLFHAVSPANASSGDTTSRLGFAYTREHQFAGVDPAPPGVLSFSHLELITWANVAGVPTNISTIQTSAKSGATLTLPFDLQGTGDIYPQSSADRKTISDQGGYTFVRILHGADRGFYVLYALISTAVSGSDAAVLRNLDGSTPTFSAEANIHIALYSAKLAVMAPVLAGPGLAGEAYSALSVSGGARPGSLEHSVLRLNWIGNASGILAFVNDPEFTAFDDGDYASGYLARMSVHSPAQGFWLTAIGRENGVTADERSNFALFTEVSTYLSDSGVISGISASVWSSQAGADPGLVALKTEDGNGNLSTSKLTPGAALVVARGSSVRSDPFSWETAPAGRGSGIDVRGSIWVYRAAPSMSHLTGTLAFGDGGVFVEDTVGAGRWLHPSFGIYDHAASPPEGTGSLLGWEAPTELGSAGRVFPYGDFSPSLPNGLLLRSDFSLFNIPHAGLIYIEDGTALGEPYNRFIGKVLKIGGISSRLIGEEFIIQAVRRAADPNEPAEVLPIIENGVYFALHHPTETILEADESLEPYEIFGQRWYRSYLNVADYFLVGTALENASNYLLPLITVMNDVLSSSHGTEVTHGSTRNGVYPLTTDRAVVALEGERLGYNLAFASLPAVDVTAAAFDSAVAWSHEQSAGYVSHGWAVDAKAPRGPFASRWLFSNASGVITRLGPANQGSLVTDDYAVSYPLNGAPANGFVEWSDFWGGSLYIVAEDVPADQTPTVRVWQRASTFSLENRAKIRVTLIVARSGGSAASSVTVRLMAGNTVLASATSTLPSDRTEIVAELTVDTAAALLRGSPGEVSVEAEQISVVVDVPLHGLGVDHPQWVRILDWKCEQLIMPVTIAAPIRVLGSVTGSNFRLTSPAKGFDTRGPLHAHFLSNLDYGLNNSHMSEPVTGVAGQPTYRTGVQERRYTPGALRINTGVPSVHTWLVPGFELPNWFHKGVHSASISLNSGVFDPAFYIHAANQDGLAALGNPDYTRFVEPGFTGFAVPFDPPHGAILTNLALGMSFRPYFTANSTKWKIYRGYGAQWNTPIPSVVRMLRRDIWDAQEGVTVRLWRQSVAPTGLPLGEFAEWSAHLPEFGYSEQIAAWEIDLSAVVPPALLANPVDSAAVGGSTDIYAGIEHFESRNWDLLEKVSSTNQQLLRVDRRVYDYFITIEFWGGPRADSAAPDATPIYTYSFDTSREFNRDSLTLDSIFGAAGAPTNLWGTLRSYNYVDATLLAASIDPPPMVKFRGARLSYLTDRPGNGGWS